MHELMINDYGYHMYALMINDANDCVDFDDQSTA